MGNAITEELFNSIDTIVKSRIQSLPYDQTLVGTIVDTSQSKSGKYVVKIQDIDVPAYCERDDLKKDEEVYVSVPKGDYTQKKIILSKVISDPIEQVKGRPFDDYIPVYSFSNQIPKIENVKGITKLVFPTELLNLTCASSDWGYHRLGIKFSLNADIQGIKYGEYWFIIRLEGTDLTITNSKGPGKDVREYNITFDDMVSMNFFNSQGYSNQEYVIDIEGFLVSKVSFILKNNIMGTDLSGTISVRDIDITMGYPGDISTLGSGKLYIYSIDSYFYDKVKTNKTFYSRCIKESNGKAIEVKEYTCVWKIGNSIETAIPEEKENGKSLIDFQFQTTQGRQPFLFENQVVYATLGYSLNNSNIIKFTNRGYDPNTIIMEDINSFQIKAPEYNDTFNLYNSDGFLINKAEGQKIHYLPLTYNNDLTGRQLRPGDTIQWTIPENNTMLLRVGTDTTVNITENNIHNGVYSLPFRIKSFFTPHNTNNIITCILTLRDGGTEKTVVLRKQIFFGYGCYDGNYKIVGELVNKNGAHLNGILMKDQGDISINETTGALTINNSNNTYYFKATIYNNNYIPVSSENLRYSIVNNTTVIKVSDGNITEYFPIPIIKDNDYYYAGCDYVKYDALGITPTYYKGKYQLFNGNTEIQDVVWRTDLNLNEIHNLDQVATYKFTGEINGEIVIKCPIIVIKENKIGNNSIGSSEQPVYINSSGQIVVATDYSNATVKALTSKNIGGATTPVYFNENGMPVACTSYDRASVASANTLGNKVAGNETTPVYFNGGVPYACGSVTAKYYDISGNGDKSFAALIQRIEALENRVKELENNG